MITYILTKFGADWSIFVDKSVKKVIFSNFSKLRANHSGCSGSIGPIIELIRDLMGRYIVAKVGTDWSIFADASVLTKSNMANFQGQFVPMLRTCDPLGGASFDPRDII